MTFVVSFFEEYMLSKMIWQNSERLFTWINYFWAFADVDYWQDQDGQHVKKQGEALWATTFATIHWEVQFEAV